jgi:3-phenylpropionate/trans-cinnamate dioxygenase ferredoxin reductase subunit
LDEQMSDTAQAQQTQQTFVIAGAGQAGAETAIELRKLGFTGRVILIGEETHPPYKRPPLSKGFLAGSVTQEQLYVMPLANLEKQNIEFHGGAHVQHIDRAAKTLHFADGSTLAYDKLALTTGGRPRLLSMPNADKPNVFPVRTINDIEAMRVHSTAGKRVVIIGGGFIGLEAAAVAVKLGLKVTILEGLPRVLARVTSPEVSAFFERIHREAGADVRTGVQIVSLDGDGAVTHVTLGDGTKIDADFVVAGIGLIANSELAQEAGLAVDNGIVVDEFARTSDPDIYAAGDCTNHPSEFLGRRVRLESVQNAMEQGRNAARNMMGKNEPYHMVPWFWSDQYDCKLQMVGISTGYDQLVLRGDPATQRSFAAFYLKDGRIIAADAVSKPQEFMFSKKLVAMRAVIEPARLADETVPMKDLVPAA